MATEREKMVAGELYDAFDADLVAARRHARTLYRRFNASEDDDEQRTVLALLLRACPATAQVVAPFHCDYGWNIALGEHCFVNFGCVMLDTCEVSLGAHSMLGPAVHIYTATHPLDAAERRLREYGRPVRIGSDVWLGGGVVVCPGVTVGDRAVVGAGSVVTRDVPPDCVAAGNPCRIIRRLRTEPGFP